MEPSVSTGNIQILTKGSRFTDQVAYANLDGQGSPLSRLPLIRNWSGTHAVTPELFSQPTDLAGLQSVLAAAQMAGAGARPVGEALSPNGLSFRRSGMVSMAQMNKIQFIDPGLKLVRAQAGALVSDVSAALRRFGLCLPVTPSISTMSLGGYLQAGVHGTGARLPPADAACSSFTLVTPGRGTLKLGRTGTPDDPDGSLFRLANMGLGALGVVAEVTIECDRIRWLVESTTVMSRQDAMTVQAELLATKRHVRYMWIPYTDRVIVVTHEEAEPGTSPNLPRANSAAQSMRHFEKLIPDALAIRSQSTETQLTPNDLGPTLLRQWLLSAAPTDATWVSRINHAEAAYWSDNAGGRAGWSDELLTFDCGGSQWVAEVAFPAGTVEAPNQSSCLFMKDLLDAVESRGLPAPAPVEQRWTCGSPSTMSPVAGGPSDLFSWVGIVMYVPDSDSPKKVEQVRDAFNTYASLLTEELAPRYNAAEHWAKIMPSSRFGVSVKRKELERRFPIAEWQAARSMLDPKGILSNGLLTDLIPHHIKTLASRFSAL